MALVRVLEDGREVVTAEQAEVEKARDFLAELRSSQLDGASVSLPGEGAAVHMLPPELSRLVRQVLEVVAAGGTVTVGSMPPELTTTAAAALLGISRPTLMKMIKDGTIPAHKVGTHSRLWTRDVLALQERQRNKQREAFEELRALEDELGITD